MSAIIEKENFLLTYVGSNFLKQRLILSILSGKPIKIVDIRSNHIKSGLEEHEVGLLRLFDKITNGTKITLNESGTVLIFIPGMLNGGCFTHNCSNQRGIGYFLDALLALAPFCKTSLEGTLTGVTNSKDSPSIDHIKASCLPLLKNYMNLQHDLELKIIKRGLMPQGGGEVYFKCSTQKQLRDFQSIQCGMIKRIRGVAYGCKISPEIINRTVHSAKEALFNFIPDVYIQTDQNKGKFNSESPGIGINLVAETTNGIFYSVESISNTKDESNGVVIAEDLGREASLKLLDEIYRGGCVDTCFQWIVVLYMALGQKNVLKFLTGPLSQYTIKFLQHLNDFFAVTFRLENPNNNDVENIPGSQKVLLTCIGIGYLNVNKRVF